MHARRSVSSFLGCVLVALALLVAAARPADAVPGDLDPTFSGDGIQTVSALDGADDGALQPDGKLVVASDRHGAFAVARFNLDGSLDKTFSGDGIATVSLGSKHRDGVAGVAIHQGKIYLVGTDERSTGQSSSTVSMALVRLKSDGSLDTTFNGTGVKLIRVGKDSTGNTIVVQGNGRILAGGTSEGRFLLVRCLGTGAADTSFSGDGHVTVAMSESVSNFLPIEVGLDPTDGRAVIGGTLLESDGFAHDFALVAVTTAGALDTGFSGDGKMIRATSTAGGFGGLTILSNGRIVAVGETDKGEAKGQFLVEKYTRSGDFDTTFGGGDGAAVFGFDSPDGKNDDGAAAVRATSGGKLVVAGATTGVHQSLAVVRLTSTGSLDPTFGNGGAVATRPPGADAGIGAVAINPTTHKIYAIGSRLVNQNRAGALVVRFLG